MHLAALLRRTATLSQCQTRPSPASPDLPPAPRVRKLVLCGVGAADAVGAILRLLALGVEPDVLGASLAGVLRNASSAASAPSAAKRTSRRPASVNNSVLHRRRLDALPSQGLQPVPQHRLRRPHWLLRAVRPDCAVLRCPCRATRAELLTLAQPSGAKSLKVDGAEKVKTGITTLPEFLIACSLS